MCRRRTGKMGFACGIQNLKAHQITMRAEALQLVDEFSIDALRFASVDVPETAANEVLVRVHAVSLNYRDLMVVRGLYNPKVHKPRTLCSDGAGEVLAVGSAVREFAVGDRVVAGFFPDWIDGSLTDAGAASALGEATEGVLTTVRNFPAHALVKVPAALSFTEAAALPCAGVTAWNALVEIGNIGAGDTALLLGTGGVSTLALQIAHLRGATTIITSSSEAKLEQAKALGATHTLHTAAGEDWSRAVRDLTGGHGATHIVEVGGAGTLPLSLRAAARNGLVAMIGILSGVQQPLNVLPVLMNGLRVQGIYVGSVAMLSRLVQTFADHGIHPPVGPVFPFHEAKDAFRTLDAATHFGKIVVELA